MPSGIIVSETEPGKDNRYYWFKHSTRQWFRLNDEATQWVEVYDEPALVTQDQLEALADVYAAIDHTHPNLDDLPDIVTLLNSGVTGTKEIAGHQVTFNHGVLVNYQPPA